jgi:competence protein ComEC
LEGLVHVLERYDVEFVLLPRMPHTSDLQKEWLHQLKEAIEQQQVQYRFAWDGQELRISEDLLVRVLGPFSEEGEIVAPAGKTNNAAIVTRVEFNDFSFLLTSDAEAVTERMLVERRGAELDVDVLKAGHHGSKTSTTAELIGAATPASVVISVGKDNRYGHPHPTVIERLKGYTVFRTDEHGSVSFLHQKGKWLIKTQRN